ncbi:MAG: prolipoprotein diacylglyceryl transferase, partial [Elusimicrobiota bacterium]
YLYHPVEIFKLWEGGLVFYGGFAAGIAAVIVFVRRTRELRLWNVGDVCAPALTLAHSFGRVGCFFAGCCYGRECQLPWAISFTNPGSLAPIYILRHPTQLYEAVGTLALFFVLDRQRRGLHAEGTTFGWYLISYSLLRFIIEFFRGDDRGGAVMGLSPSQVFSLFALTAGIVILWFRKKRVM